MPSNGEKPHRPLRLLVLDHTAAVSSVRSRWKRLAAQADVDLTLLAPARWIENAAPAAYVPTHRDGIREVVGRASWPGNAMKFVYVTGLFRAFRASRPEVVLMMEEPFSLVAVQTWLARRLLSRHARTAFYACWILPLEQMFFRPKMLFRSLARVMTRRVDAGMCINDRSTECLRAAGYQSVRTNFFGVDEQTFVPMARDEARDAIGLPQGERIFLYAGRALFLKGIQDLIEAFGRLSSERADTPMRLLIVGSGEYRDDLAVQARRSTAADSIDFRESVPNELIRTFMCAADAFVLPSRHDWHEQFGRVLAEAMLVGTPVIGSTSGEIPRVIDDGGFLFRADDPADLKKAMASVLDEPAEVARRAAIARDKALREYSVAAFIDRTISLLEELSDRDVRRTTTAHAPHGEVVV